MCPHRSPQVRVAGVRAAGQPVLLRAGPLQPLRRQPRTVQDPELQEEVQAGSAGGGNLLPGRVGRLRPQTVRAAGWEVKRLPGFDATPILCHEEAHLFPTVA